MGKLAGATLVVLALAALGVAQADDTDDCGKNWFSLVFTEGARIGAACERQAAKEEVSAEVKLGTMYRYGWGAPADSAKAIDWYRKAADQGDATGEENLGEMYYQGNGVPQDYLQAGQWFGKAGGQGEPWAEYYLGLMHSGGQGFQQDYQVAVNWYRKSVEQGNSWAQNDLGNMYASGQGVPQDYGEAVKLLLLAANQSNSTAEYNLANLYREGHGVPKKYSEAAKWYRKSADLGNAWAQFSLGLAYFDGQGVQKSYTEAAKWLRKSADQGYATAQFDLGLMYFNGQGLPKSYADAAKWYRKGAEQGDSSAQNNLGLLYENGEGVPKDYVQAYMWFNLGATSGDNNGGRNRDAIEKLMTAEQIAEAQKRTSQWQPKGPEVAATSSVPQAPNPPAAEASSEVFGTGFFISGDGEALTNAHVVEGCNQPRIKVAGQYVPARIVARDSQNDLALVKADVQPTEIAHFRLSVRQGEDVEVYGFPLADLLSSSGNVTSGNVTALSGLGDDTRFFQISAPVQPGNSGGPLFDQSGNVIGVVVGKLDALKIASITSDIPQNVNFAIKAAVVASFLDSNSVTYASGDLGTRLPAADIVERAKAFTVQIECQK